MKKGSSPEKKQKQSQMVEFPHLLLPSNIFSHLDKHHSIPQDSQIKTAIIRILSLRHEWAVLQFIKEIHARSLQSNFSMKVVLLYAVVLVVKPLLELQYSFSGKITQKPPYFISLVNEGQFKVAGVELRVPKQNQNIFPSILISLINFLKEIGIQVIKNGEGIKANEGMVRYESDYFGSLRMPSQMVFLLTGQTTKIEFSYRYNLSGHPKLLGNPLRVDDFMRLGRYLRYGPLAGLQVQQIRLFNSLSQFMKQALKQKKMYLILLTDSIFINSTSDSIELQTSMQPLKHEKILPINFFQCTSADRSIFIKDYNQFKYADYYSAGIIFLRGIAIKHQLEWFIADLEKNIGILERKIVLEMFIGYIQEEKYFTDRESIHNLRKWLHLDESSLQNHPYFDYSGDFQKAISSLQAENSSDYFTPQLKSLISPPTSLQKVIMQTQFLKDLGCSELQAHHLIGENCLTCLDGRIYVAYCKHEFCLNCYYIGLQQELLLNQTNPISLTCPQGNCVGIVSTNVISQLLTAETDKREFKKALLKNLLTDGSRKLSSFCFCIKDIWEWESQELFFYQKKNKQVFICQCNQSRCTSCLLLFHLPLTCAEFSKQQQHILQQVERNLNCLKISHITNKLLKIYKLMKWDKLLQDIPKLKILVGEWLRISLCFASKCPQSKLGTFFQDLALQASIKMQKLYTQEKQQLEGQKTKLVKQLSTLMNLRRSFLLSTFL